MGEWSQIRNVRHTMFPLQMLPEIVLTGPVLELLHARVYVTPVDSFVRPADFVDAFFMSVEVVVGAETLDALRAARHIALVGFFVSRLMFPCQAIVSKNATNTKRE